MATTRLLAIPLAGKSGRKVEIWREGDRLVLDLTDAGPAGEATMPEEEALALGEAEWLEAELIALAREAAERAESLDRTLAHVTERCAAIGKA